MSQGHSAGAGQDNTARASAGRPRRFEPADELRRLFDAALVVMQRNGYADVAVADILAEAGLSTRSFYRHQLHWSTWRRCQQHRAIT